MSDSLKDAKLLADGLMQRIRADVKAGKGGFLHQMFRHATKAQRHLDQGTSVVREVDEVFAGYLPEIKELAAARGVDLDDENAQIREQLIREADAGDRKAQYALSQAYHDQSYGLERDFDKHLEYLVKAARQGSHIAILSLYYDSENAGTESVFRSSAMSPDFLEKLAGYHEEAGHLAANFGVILDLDFDGDDPDGSWKFIPELSPEFPEPSS